MTAIVSDLMAADDIPEECFGADGTVVPDEHGSLPTCTVAGDGTVTLDYPDAPGAGVPGSFVALFVLVLVLGVAGAAWRVSTARSMARRAGLDEQSAASMAMLTDHGLEATYLASSLRQDRAATPGPTDGAAADRLLELRSLLDRGLITQSEHDEQRAQIIAGI